MVGFYLSFRPFWPKGKDLPIAFGHLLCSGQENIKKVPFLGFWPVDMYFLGHQMARMAILAILRDPGRTGQRGRLGPPESVEKPENTEKHGKGPFSTFLRGTRAVGQGCHLVAIVRSLAHSVPASSSNMRGCLGSWSPGNVVGPIRDLSVMAFPGP